MSEKSICKLVSNARTIYLSGQITQATALRFRTCMSRLLRQDASKPVTVEVNSGGGDLDAAFLIVDTIRTAGLPVHTLVTGCAMSAAALILAAGHRRTALPNATVMVHQGSFSFNGTYAEVMNEMSTIRRAEEQYARMLEKFTSKHPGFWEEKWKGADFYMDAEDAKSHGIIDTVLAEAPCW